MDKFLYVEDIMEITGFKETKCRNIIRELNSELKKKGYIIFRNTLLFLKANYKKIIGLKK